MSKGSNGADEVGPGEAQSRRRSGEPLGTNSEIGRKLKQYFEDVVSEGVPDRFSQLLSQLERSDSPRGSTPGAE